jgi:hypothetical protein
VAQERDAHVEPRRAVRTDLALLRTIGTDGEPRRRARIHRGGAGHLRRERALHRSPRP